MALAAGVTGCTKTQTSGGGGETSQTAGPQKGGTLSYYIGEPAAIDPYNTQESEGTNVESNLFDSLTAFDPLDPAKLVPAAAEKWSANSDATVWTFNLNKNDKFADGTPVTAKDFIYAWNRIANPKTINTATKKVDPSQISYHLAPVKGFDEVQAGKATEMSGLKAVDDYTLEVTLSKPMGDFEYVVGHPALAPVPQKLVEGGVDFNGKKVAFGEMPVGNGPFKASEPWKPGQSIKCVRNENYYGEQPLLDGVDFRIFKDPDTAYLEFQAGNLDFAQITLGKIKEAQSKYGTSDNGYTVQPGKQVLLGSENSVYYLVTNTSKAPMTNDKFRRALSLGINRQAICDTEKPPLINIGDEHYVSCHFWDKK
jgi:peptide/nickel transport system substrate-binding protein/oligopeptide transport system substrate-binding protein